MDTHLDLHSFPTRRSSDLCGDRGADHKTEERPKVLRRRKTREVEARDVALKGFVEPRVAVVHLQGAQDVAAGQIRDLAHVRSEEHTSELQSPDHLVCRLLL